MTAPELLTAYELQPKAGLDAIELAWERQPDGVIAIFDAVTRKPLSNVAGVHIKQSFDSLTKITVTVYAVHARPDHQAQLTSDLPSPNPDPQAPELRHGEG